MTGCYEIIIREDFDTEKEQTPRYEILEIDFNSETRVSKILFLRSQKYRTIDRYYTQNYVRYPVYSEWKTREKTISKTVKLTNYTLERLNIHEDELIRKFADVIIFDINKPDLIPSWLIIKTIKEECSLQVQAKKTLIKNTQSKTKALLEDLAAKIKLETDKISVNEIEKTKVLKKIAKKECQIAKIIQRKKSMFLTIITLFLYLGLKSKKRRIRLEKKKIFHETVLERIQSEIDRDHNEISRIQKQIGVVNKNSKDQIQYANSEIEKLIRQCENRISQVRVLDFTVKDKTFIPLKSIIGMEYEQIIGCYIIHNTGNDKHYVGQSKDVLKRIKQHFKGTVPNNAIFAEDYYQSKIENREMLFEVKIIKCTTKDELDKTERELIEAYDSRNSGYNATKGNT